MRFQVTFFLTGLLFSVACGDDDDLFFDEVDSGADGSATGARGGATGTGGRSSTGGGAGRTGSGGATGDGGSKATGGSSGTGTGGAGEPDDAGPDAAVDAAPDAPSASDADIDGDASTTEASADDATAGDAATSDATTGADAGGDGGGQCLALSACCDELSGRPRNACNFFVASADDAACEDAAGFFCEGGSLPDAGFPIDAGSGCDGLGPCCESLSGMQAERCARIAQSGNDDRCERLAIAVCQ